MTRNPLGETDDLVQFAKEPTDAACGRFGHALLMACGVSYEDATHLMPGRVGRAIKSSYVDVMNFMSAVASEVKTINLFHH